MDIVIEQHPDGFVSYLLGSKLVVVGQGGSCEEALAEIQSAVRFHIETFGSDVLEVEYMSNMNSSYVLCIKNENYPASLEFGKVYEVLSDEKAKKHKMLRVINESGEDYLYPASYFVAIKLPRIAQEAFTSLRH